METKTNMENKLMIGAFTDKRSVNDIEPLRDSMGNVGVISNVYSLARRSIEACYDWQFNELFDDLELLESAPVDENSKKILNGSSRVLRQQFDDYQNKKMREFVALLNLDFYYSLRMATYVGLCNIGCALMKIDVEKSDTTVSSVPSLIVNTDVVKARFDYDPKFELKLVLPRKYNAFWSKLKSSLPCGDDFKHVKKLLKREMLIRMDTINPIRKLAVKDDNHPGQEWKLTQEQYRWDIDYMRAIYVEQDYGILQLRWEWGRRRWTAYARWLTYHLHDAEADIKLGRKMEMEARSLIFEHKLLRE